MWKFLGGLVNSFLLLRDIFGYAGPGAIFLGLALFHFRGLWYQQYLTDHEALAPFWFFALVFLLLSYLAGHALAAIGYITLESLFSTGGKSDEDKDGKPTESQLEEGEQVGDEEQALLSAVYPDESVRGLYVSVPKGKEQKPSVQTQPAAARQVPPTQKELKQKKLSILRSAALLYYRYLYPPLFIDADRRATINILRISLSVGMIAGGVLCFVPVPGVEYVFSGGLLIVEVLKVFLIATGILILWNGHTGQKHVAEYYQATLKAALRAQQNGIPIFQWDESGDKKSPKEDSDDGASGKKG